MIPGPVSTGLADLRLRIAAELAQLGRELDEIGMLAQQAKAETERHEGRRLKGEERVAQLERDPQTAATEVREARQQLLTLTRRAGLFESQQQVLEGKQRTLIRFRDQLARIDAELAAMGGADPAASGDGPVVAASPDGPVSPVGPAVAAPTAESADRTAVQRGQEAMRREIARQMHDGPAQSLANIALQSEIVQRLASRGDGRTQAELEALRSMVQHALDATKEFIFDVRPMVLDDLGLVPTLRRMATDRGRRASVEVDLNSQGTERRLPSDLETGVFRLIDDFVGGFLALQPNRLVVRLDWSERELAASVRVAWLRDHSEARDGTPASAEAATRDDLPPALRAMIEENYSEKKQAKVASHTLAPELVEHLRERAQDLRVGLLFRDEGTTLELTVPLPS